MLFKSFGVPELLIILLIVVVLFGVGRLTKLGKDLGGGIRSFKEGLKGDEEEKKEDKDTKNTNEPS